MHDISAIWGRFLLTFALDKLNIRHISTSGLVDLLPRKCVTWCAPRGESFHQVWSWYDHPLPSYSVIATDTLRDPVTFTFDFSTLVSGHTWWVTWSTPPPSLKILRLSVLESWVLTSPIGYHWQCVCSHCTCAVSRDLCVGGKFFRHIWNPWPPICLFTVHLLWRYDDV